MKWLATATMVVTLGLWALAGPAAAQEAAPEATLPAQETFGQTIPEQTMPVQAAPGSVDWQSGLVTATGIGAPPANPANLAQARGMAKRAATVIARRNLLELLMGVHIDSTSTVENFMVSSDVVVSRIRGALQNSQILDTAYMSDGSVEVTVGLSLRGPLADVLLPTQSRFLPRATMVARPAVPAPAAPQAPAVQDSAAVDGLPAADAAPAAPVVPAGPFTGLVVDARGLGVRPAMSPRILDENGVEVYGTAVVGREYAIQQGMAGYAKELDRAAASDRVGRNPMRVMALRAEGAASTDLVISNDAAEMIRAAAESPQYLAECRVVIVLD
ncbi:hypothetical protein GGQ74_000277 [Desulfobaculum xiamenense]|uniref:LPP20 lipoprotein n=1 Tax=Desulfobaculum xiamenense TaxID=995050 RepID=A0A846QHX9_9BACT|nr:hypothetical protein [Desulfobaculum xiamenense]NJB66637.1 hypothetical protein [Desulfobaculum xiamenense]